MGSNCNSINRNVSIENNLSDSSQGAGPNSGGILPNELLDGIFRLVLLSESSNSGDSIYATSQMLRSLVDLKAVCKHWNQIGNSASIMRVAMKAVDLEPVNQLQGPELLSSIVQAYRTKLEPYRLTLEKIPAFEAGLVHTDIHDLILALQTDERLQHILVKVVGDHLDMCFGWAASHELLYDLDITDISRLFEVMSSASKKEVFARKPTGVAGSTWLIEATRAIDAQANAWIQLLVKHGEEANESVGGGLADGPLWD